MAKHRASFKHWLEYIGWMLVAGTLKLVPRPIMIPAADVFGWLMYHVLRVRRQTIDGQLRFALGTKYSTGELQKIARKSWQNCVLTFFEFLQPSPLLSKGWDEFREQEGYEEYCKPMLAEYGNAIVITGHIGNWEALGAVGRRENVELAAVAKAMHNPLVNDYILESRAKRGLEVLQVKSNMKNIVSAIRSGKWVAIVGDQDARRHGIFVEFFGRPASTAPGPAYFAYMLNKPLLPAFCVRIPDSGRHLKLVFGEPIYPNREADREEEIQRMTQLHTAALEEVIRRYPSDYFWLHNRWKTKPKRKQK